MGILSDTKGRKQISQALSKHYVKLCVLSYAAGIVWMCALSDSQFNNRTYFSENALLPGMVNDDYYNHKAANSLYRELQAIRDKTKVPLKWISSKLADYGIQSYHQNFSAQIPLPGKTDPLVTEGINIHGVFRAPRIAGTEAIVISVPYNDGRNMGALALMLSLAEHCRGHSYWSKDIIFLVTDKEAIGMQAWINGYYALQNTYISSSQFEGHSGAIQAAINLELSSDSLDSVEVLIEGLNGQLPNLDLINMVLRLLNKHGIPAMVHSQRNHPRFSGHGPPVHNLVSMAMMMLRQASGLPSANHGLFHKFRVEAVTLRGVKDGRYHQHGFYNIGRVLEGICRSLNNLLERFHQSFFFYLLPSPGRYVSIGMYMPPFGCLLLGPLITAVLLWSAACEPNDTQAACSSIQDGTEKVTEECGAEDKAVKDVDGSKQSEHVDESVLRQKVAFAWSPPPLGSVVPLIVLSYLGGTLLLFTPYAGYELGVVLDRDPVMTSLGCLTAVAMVIISSPAVLRLFTPPNNSTRELHMLKCASLVLYSAMLASIAAVNFSLAFFIALLTIPAYLYVSPKNNRIHRLLQLALLLLASPLSIYLILSFFYNFIMSPDYLDITTIANVTMEKVFPALIGSLRDAQLLDTWTFVVAALGIVPNWTMFWYLGWQ